MKNKNTCLIILFTALLFACELHAQQVSIKAEGANTDNSAILDIISSDKGLLIPRMDSTSRKNIAGPAKGLMVFDSTYHSFWYFDGTAWTSLNSLDQQELRLSNDSLYLTNDTSTVLLGDFRQDLSLTNDTLRLSNAPTAIDMSVYPDDMGNHIATQNIQINHFSVGKNGKNHKGIYVDSIGRISTIVGGVHRIANTYIGVKPLPDAIAESQSVYNLWGTSTGAKWQTFTIPYDGFLTKFTLYGDVCFFTSDPNITCPFEIHKANGELVATGTTTLYCSGNYAESLIDRIPVYQGEVYKITVYVPSSQFYRSHMTTTNDYSGGQCHWGPTRDLVFDYHMERDAGGYSFTDTAFTIMDNYHFPITDGNSNNILVTDGAGNLNWANTSSAAIADHLGNHTMTQGLQLNGHWLNNDGDANEGLYIDTMGRVGINTIPDANLHVPMGAAPNPGFRVNDTGVTINEYSLPMVDGTADQTLVTDGAGSVNWTTTTSPSNNQQLSISNDTLSLTDGGSPINLAPYSGADNLGNHIASQNLYIDAFSIHNTATDTTGLFLNNFNSPHVVSSSARPAEFLITQPAVGNYIEVNNNTSTRALLGAGGSDFIPGGDTLAVAVGNFSGTGGFNMWAGSAKRVQISAAGNVGIGRAATTNLLEVAGAASKATTGNWLANSDARLKQNIQKLNTRDMLDKLLSLQGIRYEWADDQTGMQRPVGIQYGFTAQNIQAVFPTLVSEDQQGYLQTAYGTYDAMTVEAIRALNRKLEKLDTQTSALEQEMDAMAELRSKIQQSRENK